MPNSDSSVYELLGNSEQIINGSVSLDWRKLPEDLKPDASEPRRHKKKTETIVYSADTDDELLNIIDSPVLRERPLTFNNCHFHYDKEHEHGHASRHLKEEIISSKTNPKITKSDAQLKKSLSKMLENNYAIPKQVMEQMKGLRPKIEKEKAPSPAMSLSEFDPIPKESINMTGSYSKAFANSNKIEAAKEVKQVRNEVKKESSLDFLNDEILEGYSRNISESSPPYDLKESIYDSVSSKKLKSSQTKSEKEMYVKVHKELCDLSEDLKARNEKLQKETKELNKLKETIRISQAALEQREKNLNKDLDIMVNAALKQKEKAFRSDTEKIITKYEEAIEQLNKENKRLQNALKEMNKRCLSEMEEKDLKLEELSANLKLAKERNERLKSHVRVGSSNAAQTVENSDRDMFSQMKKLISKSNSRYEAVNSTAQTEEVTLGQHRNEYFNRNATNLPDISLNASMLSLIQYLLNLRSTKSKISGEKKLQNMFIDAITGSFETLEMACRISPDTPSHKKNTLQHIEEMYLELIYDGIKTNLPAAEQHNIAALVYSSLTVLQTRNMTLESQKSERAILYTYLIVLASVTQFEVVEAMLDGLLGHLSTSIKSRSMVLEVGGLETLIEILTRTPTRDAIVMLVSSVMLTLISEGLKAKAFNFIACTNILYFIWIVLQFVNYSPYCVPFLSWLFNLLGELGMFLTVMGQMDILKSFVFGSHYLNKEIITKLQIGYAVYHTVCMAGLYGIIGSIGQPRSLFLEQWYVYGYELFAFSAILYENFHAIYISRELVKHKHFRNNSSANTVEMHILFRLVLLGIVIDWTAFVIWIISWFIGGSNASGLA
ncbi:hypothetical protein HK103_004994 [Boothiomyces macroporosus]|uniref:Uncharacterized protein n=1 Tax=Boothiomyces macroporosus TaxID=261099 RepID=A0AAD5UFU4_9FUNG|nr:hypothetical protein HK103_004994 [Boothiomyces macroporosus]